MENGAITSTPDISEVETCGNEQLKSQGWAIDSWYCTTVAVVVLYSYVIFVPCATRSDGGEKSGRKSSKGRAKVGVNARPPIKACPQLLFNFHYMSKLRVAWI